MAVQGSHGERHWRLHANAGPLYHMAPLPHCHRTLDSARILQMKAFARAKRPCFGVGQALLQASEACMSRRPPIPCEELRKAYAEGHSSTTIAQRYRCSPTTIIKYLRRCGITIRPSWFLAREIPEAALRRLYLEERQPVVVIAAYFDVSVSTINNKRRRYNIPTRPRRVLLPDADSIEL